MLNAHARAAAEIGIDPDVIAALRAGEPPGLTDAREQTAYLLTKGLLQSPEIGQDLFDRAVGTLGHAAISDLTVLIGYYVAAACALKFYAVPVPKA